MAREKENPAGTLLVTSCPNKLLIHAEHIILIKTLQNKGTKYPAIMALQNEHISAKLDNTVTIKC